MNEPFNQGYSEPEYNHERGRKHQRKHQDRERRPDAASVGAQDERAEGDGRPKKKEESDTE